MCHCWVLEAQMSGPGAEVEWGEGRACLFYEDFENQVEKANIFEQIRRDGAKITSKGMTKVMSLSSEGP